MATGTISLNIDLAGIKVSGAQITKTEEGQISHQVALAAGNAGTLSTRTSASAGTATLAADHTIETSDVVDVFWTGGVRYGVTVGTVDGVSVPLSDSGDGDDYPTEDDAIIVTQQVVIDSDFDGDDIEMIACHCDQRAHLDFLEDDNTQLDELELTSTQPVWYWIDDGVNANPLTGNAVGQIRASNGSIIAATLKIGILYNSAT